MNIIEQLNELKHIKPRQDWVDAERELLLSQIIRQSAAKPQSFLINSWFLAKSLMPSSLLRFVAQPVGALCVLVIFVFSTGIFGVNASRGSLPGDFLYSVKLNSEKVKVSFAVAEEKKAELHVQFAEERVKEIETVAAQDKSSTQKKEQIKVSASGLKSEMEKTMETLDKVKQESKKTKEIIETVKKVDQKTEELSARINDKKEQLKDDKEIAASLNDVKNTVDEAGVKAVEVIIDKHEKGDIKMSDSEIKETIDKIDKRINEVQKQVDQAAAQVEQVKVNVTNAEKAAVDLADSKATQTKKEEPNNIDETEITVIIGGSQKVPASVPMTTTMTTGLVQDLTIKPGEAGQKLTEAKDLLNHGDLGSAITKVQPTRQVHPQRPALNDLKIL